MTFITSISGTRVKIQDTPVIGLSSPSRGGKDLFFTLASRILEGYGVTAVRLAFADELKKELRADLWAKYQIDVLDCTDKQKEIIRPDLIAHGEKRRAESGGLYWVNKVKEQLDSHLKQKAEFTYGFGGFFSVVYFITDVRYGNEIDEISSMEGLSYTNVYIQKILKDGGKFLPKIPTEQENDLVLREKSEHTFEWNESLLEEPSLYALQRSVKRFIKSMNVCPL